MFNASTKVKLKLLGHNLKIAYLILAHKNPLQLKRLITRLMMDNVLFFVHIDSKVSIEDFKILFEQSPKNIFFISNRENGQWGDIGIVKATINLLNEAVKFDCDYFILLSGMDYPIKTNNYINSFLKENFGKSFIEYQKFPVHDLNYQGHDRIEGYSYTLKKTRQTYVPYRLKPKFSFIGHVLNIILLLWSIGKGKRKKPFYVKDFYYGSQWWILYKREVIFVLRYLEDNPDYLSFHKYSLIPDEIFFQTILLNNYSSDQENIVNRNYRFLIWKKDANHPQYLHIKDNKCILDSDALFARKFEENADILKIIDLKIKK